MGNEAPRGTIKFSQTGGLGDQRVGENFPSKILVRASTLIRICKVKLCYSERVFLSSSTDAFHAGDGNDFRSTLLE